MSTRYRIRQRLFLVVVLVLGVWLIVRLTMGIWELWKSRERVVEAENEVEKLQSEAAKLQQQLDEVKSQVFLEGEIRDKLGLARPNEIVVLLPENLPAASMSGVTTEEPEEMPIWRRWLKLFW